MDRVAIAGDLDEADRIGRRHYLRQLFGTYRQILET
jgi:hypothetical protein